MGLELVYINGQTPIDEDEKEGLKIKTISTRGELDEFEQKNIEKAIAWSIGKRFSIKEILSEDFILEVHKQMFDVVWRWAGIIRKTDKSNGRHSRLCADILISDGLKRPLFSWGKDSISKKGETRTRYLNAIYKADQGIYDPLIEFARS